MLRAAAEGTVADVADQEGDVVLAHRFVGSLAPHRADREVEESEPEAEHPCAGGSESSGAVLAVPTAPSTPPLRAPAAPTLATMAEAREAAGDWGCWERWGERRDIRASVLAWAVGDVSAAELILRSGVALRNARIVGRVVLDGAILRRPASLVRCAIEEGMSMQGASLPSLNLSGCHVGGLDGGGAIIGGSCSMARVVCRGGINLAGSRIKGTLECGNCSIESSWLSNHTIHGDGRALCASQVEVLGNVDLSGCTIDGVVDLSDARIGGQMRCCHSAIENSKDYFGGDVLRCVRAHVEGNVDLECAGVKGGVRLDRAEIGGDLRVRKARIRNPEYSDCNGGFEFEPAISALACAIGGDALLIGAEIVGGVLLVAAKIRGDLRCLGADIAGASLVDRRAFSLLADRVRIDGDVRIGKGAKLAGDTRLVGAQIGGDFVLEDCCLSAWGREPDIALRVDSARVAGDLRLLGTATKFNGGISMTRVDVGGDLQLHGLECSGSVTAERAVVRSTLELGRGDAIAVSGTLDLRGARVSRLRDTASSWGGAKTIDLRGLQYDFLSDRCEESVEQRLAWVERGTTDANGTWRYDAFVFHRLAKAYLSLGRAEDAIRVRQAQYMARRRYDKPRSFWDLGSGARYWWRWLVIRLLGCGYNRLGPLYAMFVLWLIGGLVFQAANRQGLMVPASDQVLTTSEYQQEPGRKVPLDYQPMNVWTYSADAMLPFIDLHQERFWLPKRDPDPDRWRAIVNLDRGTVFGYPFPDAGRFVRWYLWFHIAAGWILSTLFVVGLSGIVKNEDGKSQDE